MYQKTFLSLGSCLLSFIMSLPGKRPLVAYIAVLVLIPVAFFHPYLVRLLTYILRGKKGVKQRDVVFFLLSGTFFAFLTFTLTLANLLS